MLALFIVFLVVRFIWEKDKKRKEKISILLVLSLFAGGLLFSATIITFSAPDELAKTKEQVIVMEEQLEDLSNFRFVAKEGTTVEELRTFLNEYDTLCSKLKNAESEVECFERQMNPNSFGNRFSDIILDFGLIKKILSYYKS